MCNTRPRHQTALLLYWDSSSQKLPLLFFGLQHPSHRRGSATSVKQHILRAVASIHILFSFLRLHRPFFFFPRQGIEDKTPPIRGFDGGVSEMCLWHQMAKCRSQWRDTCNMDAALKNGYFLSVSGWLFS